MSGLALCSAPRIAPRSQQLNSLLNKRAFYSFFTDEVPQAERGYMVAEHTGLPNLASERHHECVTELEILGSSGPFLKGL